MYENYCKLRDKKGYKDADIAKATGITKSTFSDWKSGRSQPKNDKLQKIADFFGVTIDYLMTGQETSLKTNPADFNARDERDIKRTLDSLMDTLDSKDGAPLFYDGQEMSPETRLLFETQL